MSYHQRTHHPDDRIVDFEAYTVEQDSPAPGESQPSNVRASVFLSDR
jgi:hypothetical protein